MSETQFIGYRKQLIWAKIGCPCPASSNGASFPADFNPPLCEVPFKFGSLVRQQCPTHTCDTAES